MNVLIVEEDRQLGRIWAAHLGRCGHKVTLCRSSEDAISALSARRYEIIVLNLVLQVGSALAVSDYAEVCQPDSKVIFVTSTSFFSDGSIFALSGNACAYLTTATPPEDIAAVVDHHGRVA